MAISTLVRKVSSFTLHSGLSLKLNLFWWFTDDENHHFFNNLSSFQHSTRKKKMHNHFVAASYLMIFTYLFQLIKDMLLFNPFMSWNSNKCRQRRKKTAFFSLGIKKVQLRRIALKIFHVYAEERHERNWTRVV